MARTEETPRWLAALLTSIPVILALVLAMIFPPPPREEQSKTQSKPQPERVARKS